MNKLRGYLCISACVDCVELIEVMVTTTVKGSNTNTSRNLCWQHGTTFSIYTSYHTIETITYQHPYHLHAVGQCLKQDKLSLTPNIDHTTPHMVSVLFLFPKSLAWGDYPIPSSYYSFVVITITSLIGAVRNSKVHHFMMHKGNNCRRAVKRGMVILAIMASGSSRCCSLIHPHHKRIPFTVKFCRSQIWLDVIT